MIHTEKGRLTELISMMEKDREFVAETLGVGPSKKRVRDKTLVNSPVRLQKFQDRLAMQNDVIAILKAMI